MPVYLYALVLALGVWLTKKWFVSRQLAAAPYPPGPKPKPLIGNVFDFPTSDAHEGYLELGKQYSSGLVYGTALGTKVLVLNKLDDAIELLDRRARETSDRPNIPIVDLGVVLPSIFSLSFLTIFRLGWDRNIVLLPYGKIWRFHRKICQQNFRAEAARDYHPLLLKKCGEMLLQLLVDPQNFEQHNKMFSISVALITMFGYEIKSLEDPCIVAAEESIRLAGPLLFPGGSWLNIVPALRYIPSWFPGAVTRKVAAKVRELTEEVWRIPFEDVKRRVAEGVAIPSFVSNFLKQKAEVGASGEQEKAVINIAFTVYSAASDTTISATGSFFYLMACNPEIQRKAQAEIDRIICPGRLPNFEDRPSLPYIDAIYREVLRFKPPVPLGVAHSIIEDDYYRGYYIPKGTMIFANIWAMTRDAQIYPEPLKFKPERFLDSNGNLNGDDRVLAYGFGRRACVGKYIASDTLWITFASVLACFNIDKCTDKFGNVIGFNDDYHELGLGQFKSDFLCSFVPRSATAKQLSMGSINTFAIFSVWLINLGILHSSEKF
ncbi:cytochrome P450 [Gymnopilus junonius]|uniref:Cytochrome P450 n=1 Tax=Gymnopilus junonius TaxID=109634 RepID=A0A9P5NGG9_GYMJU|nr:cytochrome P450 [Gymnopilus junonius]